MKRTSVSLGRLRELLPLDYFLFNLAVTSRKCHIHSTITPCFVRFWLARPVSREFSITNKQFTFFQEGNVGEQGRGRLGTTKIFEKDWWWLRKKRNAASFRVTILPGAINLLFRNTCQFSIIIKVNYTKEIIKSCYLHEYTGCPMGVSQKLYVITRVVWNTFSLNSTPCIYF